MCVTPALLQQTIFSHPAIQSFNPYSRAVFEKLKHCHTAQMGMHRFQCDDPECKHIHWQYHSCGNRHCPNCGSGKKDEWIEFKTVDLLPTDYYHVVFTLPHELNPLIMGHRTDLFKLLFQASSHTLLTLGKNEKYLGAEIGFTAILHTWGQDLSFHPHVHCTHKVAITRHRILHVSDDSISFRYKDYADGDKLKEMTLTHPEFLRRFEQHSLPKGLMLAAVHLNIRFVAILVPQMP